MYLGEGGGDTEADTASNIPNGFTSLSSSNIFSIAISLEIFSGLAAGCGGSCDGAVSVGGWE